MSKRKKQLATQTSVVAELGGISATARLTRRRPPQVFYWLHERKSFPAKFYFLMQNELRARGCYAPRTLWDFEAEHQQNNRVAA